MKLKKTFGICLLLAFATLGEACAPTVVSSGCTSADDCQDNEVCNSEGICVTEITLDGGVVGRPDAGVGDVQRVDASGVDAGPADVVLPECLDGDDDGYGTNCDLGDDCDDNNNTLHTERLQYVDADNDTYTVGEGTLSCSGDTPPIGFQFEASAFDDCNDDESEQFVESEVYADGDGDGFTLDTPERVCNDGRVPLGFRSTPTALVDCNDERSEMAPGLDEICDGLDNDCDGQADATEVCGLCVVSFMRPGVGLVSQNAAVGDEDRLHPYLVCPLRSWVDARAGCQSVPNYDLVLLETQQEFNNLRIGGNFAAWIGLTDALVEGQFRFIVPGGNLAGEPISYNGFLPGEPNNRDNEDCVELRSASVEPPNGGYNDSRCGDAKTTICESYIAP